MEAAFTLAVDIEENSRDSYVSALLHLKVIDKLRDLGVMLNAEFILVVILVDDAQDCSERHVARYLHGQPKRMCTRIVFGDRLSSNGVETCSQTPRAAIGGLYGQRVKVSCFMMFAVC